MNKKDFVKLCFNYNKEPNEELYELWNYNLRCYDEEEIQKAINIVISNDKYFPTLNRILEVVKEIVLKENVNYENENYIKEKMIKHNIHPSWINKEIINDPIDEETNKVYEDFNSFINELRHN